MKKIVRLELLNGDVCYTLLDVEQGDPLIVLGAIFEDNVDGSIGATYSSDGEGDSPFLVRVPAIATAHIQ